MSWTAVAAGLVVLSVWLAVPSPRARLRRLEGGRTAVVEAGALDRLLAGRAGSPPVRQRAALGVVAGLLVALLVPGTAGAVAGVAVVAAGTVASGWLWPVAGPDPAVGEQLPGTLDLLAACLEAGAPMRTAVDTVARVSPPATAEVLAQVAGRMRIGRTESEAWAELVEDHWWGQVARDVGRSARSGTSLVEGLRIHAEDHRRRVATDRQKRARAVGVRSVVPLMACFLPAFVLVGVVPVIAGLLGDFFS